jgi:hypothetical protein
MPRPAGRELTLAPLAPWGEGLAREQIEKGGVSRPQSAEHRQFRSDQRRVAGLGRRPGAGRSART